MPAHNFLKASDEELLSRADQCLERAGTALEAPHLRMNIALDEQAKLRLFLEAQSCLAEVLRRQAEQTAERDRKRNEEIAERDLQVAKHTIFLEKVVVGLICIEILLSVHGLREGHQQGKVLEKQTTALTHMDTTSAATADAMKQVRDSLQQLVTAQDEALKIFHQQEADRAKKPSFTLDVANIPLPKSHANHTPTQETDGNSTYHLDLWSRGDVSANKLFFRALVSAKDVSVSSNLPGLSAEPDPYHTSVQSFLLPLFSVRSHSYDPIDITFSYQKGHPPFSVTFTVDSEELRTPTTLGVLTVTPRKPTN